MGCLSILRFLGRSAAFPHSHSMNHCVRRLALRGALPVRVVAEAVTKLSPARFFDQRNLDFVKEFCHTHAPS
jgi:ribosomal protein L4